MLPDPGHDACRVWALWHRPDRVDEGSGGRAPAMRGVGGLLELPPSLDIDLGERNTANIENTSPQ